MMRTALREGWSLLKESIDLWTSSNAFQLAGALAFYTLFSMAPLLIIVISITGMVFGEEAVRGEIASQIDQFIGSDAAAMVQDAVRNSRIEEAGLLPTLLGVGALLFGATTVFAQLQAALNSLWGVKARPSRRGIVVFILSRLVSFGMVLVIGFLLLMSFLMTMAVGAMVQFAEDWIPFPSLIASSLDLGISVVVAFLLFGLIFKVLPDVRLSWGNVAAGAALTAVLFVLGQYFISLYLTHAGPASTYGAAGSLVLILMWVYYSALIIFFGAAFTRANVRRRGGVIHPSAGAVKVHTEIVEETPGRTPDPGGSVRREGG